MPPFVVYHYETPAGRDPIAEFLEDQPSLERAACDEVISWLGTGELDKHPQHSAYIGDGIWELRVSSNRKQYRFLYGSVGSNAYILVAFIKKTPQTPRQHIQQARKRWRELEERGERR